MRRGENVALTREIPTLRGVVLGVGWNTAGETALADNLTMLTVLCGPDGRALSDEHVVFFNQLTSPDLSAHRLERALGGDQEQLEVDLAGVPEAVGRIVVVVYVNEGPAHRRTLGRLRSLYVRVLDLADNRELVRSEELATALTDETAVVLGELYRHQGGWKFRVLGQGYDRGIVAVAADYGIGL